jgi:deoxyribodipyrimidine photo-lyase
MSVPSVRIRAENDAPLRPAGEYVLYWSGAYRRTSWSFALDRAIEHARTLGKPLVVYEPVKTDYPWASDRMHRFMLEGMADNAARYAGTPVAYFPYVEPEKGAINGLVGALAARACVVVSDDFPAFFLPKLTKAVAASLDVRFESVDSNGLFPMHATTRVFTTAFSFRAYLQKQLPEYLADFPVADPLSSLELPQASIPAEILARWPAASPDLLRAEPDAIAALPIDHSVGTADMRGGSDEARRVLASFVGGRIDRYADERSEPGSDASSGLSPWLHFGHLSVHEVFDAVVRRESWTPERIGKATGGHREGWWGMSRAAESFMDELVTWREIGFNLCSHRDDYDRFESLPDFAKATLEKHAADPRPHVYSREELDEARTHDPLWNAAQRQLVREGRIHNYLRMLWGKKVLEWSRTPQEALETLVHLNNRYAVDGRDPNSYSGIFWVFGRYDRAWGPERPIFGSVRYMSSDNTARKLDVKGYLAKYGSARTAAQGRLF